MLYAPAPPTALHGVAGAFWPKMLEFTSGVAADNGVPGMAYGPGVPAAAAAAKPASVDMLAVVLACTVLLLHGASAARGGA
jgi:hypothetical protein